MIKIIKILFRKKTNGISECHAQIILRVPLDKFLNPPFKYFEKKFIIIKLRIIKITKK